MALVFWFNFFIYHLSIKRLRLIERKIFILSNMTKPYCLIHSLSVCQKCVSKSADRKPEENQDLKSGNLFKPVHFSVLSSYFPSVYHFLAPSFFPITIFQFLEFSEKKKLFFPNFLHLQMNHLSHNDQKNHNMIADCFS